ncbi:MAG: ComEC/Rec2 family competence protein, partial [Alphaproteobacteria bacterium]
MRRRGIGGTATRRGGSPGAGAPRGLRDRLGIRDRLRLVDLLAEERTVWPLWLPVFLGVGIAVYFGLPVEPPRWLGGAFVAAGLAGCVIFRRWRPAWLFVGVAAVALAAGFAAAQMRTAAVEAPRLARALGPVALTARVLLAQPETGGARLLLDRVKLSGRSVEAVPERVRVRVRGRGAGDIRVGSWVQMRARLSPPPEPVAPGAFDFARRLYFQGIGAVGFAFGAPRTVVPPEGDAAPDWRMRLNVWRQAWAARIRATLPPPAGPVAAALMTGERRAISADVLARMRDSGLAHLLAISGLHMGLVAGILFFVLRAALAAWESVALRQPIKKWAAVGALIGALGYMLFAGATVPTQRAFLMVGLMLGAILLDRRAISARPVAWAAAIILLVAPESLLGASFQMSFAAVVALVAGYTLFWPRLAVWRRRGGLGRGLAAYVAGVALTSMIAATATAPYAIFHFNRLAAYGLAANLVAVPVMALWIMPWALVAFLLLPLGVEGLALAPMGAGIDAMLWVAETVAGWKGSVNLLPAMSTGGLALVTLGGLWLCLWQRPWRLAGVVGIAAGLAGIALHQPPDILVTGDARLMGVRLADGDLALSSRVRGRFAAGIWERRAGRDGATVWPRDGATADGLLACDRLGCIYRRNGHV